MSSASSAITCPKDGEKFLSIAPITKQIFSNSCIQESHRNDGHFAIVVIVFIPGVFTILVLYFTVITNL
jgi:hypothetical protein